MERKFRGSENSTSFTFTVEGCSANSVRSVRRIPSAHAGARTTPCICACLLLKSSVGSVVVCVIDIVLQGLVSRTPAPDVDARQGLISSATCRKGRGYHIEFQVRQSVAASVRSAARDCAALHPSRRPKVCGDTDRTQPTPMPASPVSQTLALPCYGKRSFFR